MKPKGRVPGSTRVGGELFDRPKYNRNKKHNNDCMWKKCLVCKAIRDVDEMHSIFGATGWMCDECESSKYANVLRGTNDAL